MGDERDSVCSFCGVVNRRKRLVKCDTCGCLFHLSCVGLTRAQAEDFGRWNCEQCRGVAGRDMNNFDSKISETSEIPLRPAKRKAAMESERRTRQIVN